MCQEKDVPTAASVELLGRRSHKVRLVKGLTEVMEVPDLEATGPDVASAILFGERGSVSGGAQDRPTPPWMRDAVLAREGHACAICGSRHECRVHHVDSRADGG